MERLVNVELRVKQADGLERSVIVHQRISINTQLILFWDCCTGCFPLYKFVLLSVAGKHEMSGKPANFVKQTEGYI